MRHGGRKKFNKTGIGLVCLGAGIVAVSIFPSQWMIVILAIGLVCAGVSLMKR